jgi:hypothetical protein
MKLVSSFLACAVLLIPAPLAASDTLTTTNNGMTVVDVVNTPLYGTVTITWLADANFAASLGPDSPYWVPGINPNGSMSLRTAALFIKQLNKYSYLGINTWRLPTTDSQDTTCTLMAILSGGDFAYNCGQASPTNPAYPFSDLAGLFYNVLGGVAHQTILQTHNANFALFHNIQNYLYWSETKQPNNVHFGNDFWFQNGFEGTEDEYDSMFVWPVSTTYAGTPPTMVPACAAVVNCSGVIPGLGLTTTLPPPQPVLVLSPNGFMVYDPAADMAYLTDGNFASSLSPGSPYYVKGINADGSMNASTLATFLTKLNKPSNPLGGIVGWTLPTIAASGRNPNCTLPNSNGNPDLGYNCDGIAGGAGELFYDELGGLAGNTLSEHSNWQSRLFYNLEPSYYWQCLPTGMAVPNQCLLTGGGIPSFSFLSGYQGVQSNPNDLFVMLALPGSAIPVNSRWW